VSLIFNAEAAGDVVRNLLRAQLGGGLRVYDLPVPARPPSAYVVMMVVPGTQPGGPFLGDPEADVGLTYQLDAVSSVSSSAARWLGTRARGVLLARNQDGTFQTTLTFPGYVNVERRTVSDPGRTDVEGSREHPLHVCRVQYELVWTPA
jgi:hypothetical protein